MVVNRFFLKYMRPVRKYCAHVWSSSAKHRFKLLHYEADEIDRLSMYQLCFLESM